MSEREQSEKFKVINRRDGFAFAHKICSLVAAVAVTTLTVGGGVFLLYHDKTIQGFIALGIGVASIVGSLVYGSRNTPQKLPQPKQPVSN